MSASQTVHLVDDDPQVLRALRRLLTAAGHDCETWTSAEDFLARPPLDGDGCVVVDLQLPGANGLDLQAILAARDPALPVVFLSGRGDVGTSVSAMKGGAIDFLTKPVAAADLLSAVAEALVRRATLSASRAAEAEVAGRLAQLTPREREVLDLVVAGHLNKQVAGELGIAEKTVKVHRARVMQKLGVRTVAALIRLVVRHQG